MDHRHQLFVLSISAGPQISSETMAAAMHFITSSCYHRQPWVGSASRHDLFLTVLEEVRPRYAFVVLGYVVMPEHFHLLVSEPQRGTPSTVTQALKLGFARCVLGVSCRRDRPTLSPISEPAHVWSSFRFYAYAEAGPVTINGWQGLEMRVRNTE